MNGRYPSRNNSIVSLVLTGITLCIVIGGLLAFARIKGIHSPQDLIALVKQETSQTSSCYKSWGKNCGGMAKVTLPNNTTDVNNIQDAKLSNQELGYTGPANGQAFIPDNYKIKKNYIMTELSNLKTTNKSKDKYKESEWPHWIPYNSQNPCWSMKKEVLVEQAVPGSLKFKDKNHKTTTNMTEACVITKGKWIDPYSGKTITSPKDMDVDSIISLRNASVEGGQSWTTEQKQAFANDKDTVLLAVSKDSLKEKGDKGPDKYVPKSKKYQCTFAKGYITAANKYKLSLTSSEEKALSKLIVQCAK